MQYFYWHYVYNYYGFYTKIFEPQEISNPKLILIVGIAGLVSNGVGLVLFHEHGHSHSHGSGGGSDHSGDSNITFTFTFSWEATTFSQGDEEEHIGTEENEHTPLLYNITHTTMKSTPSEVFDYLPDNVVERYSNYQPSFSGQSPLNGTSANSSDANTW